MTLYGDGNHHRLSADMQQGMIPISVSSLCCVNICAAETKTTTSGNSLVHINNAVTVMTGTGIGTAIDACKRSGGGSYGSMTECLCKA